MAPDKFKGSLDARGVAHALDRGIRRTDPTIQVDVCPIADGGEGTVAAAIRAGYESHSVSVTGPLGESVAAEFAIRDGSAVLEMCSAAGLAQLPQVPDPRSALLSDTTGVGELIRHALDFGAQDLVLGLGGSATSDGGMGALRALGARIKTRHWRASFGGGALNDVVRVDLSTLDARLLSTPIVLATDVANPLLGPTGSATMFSPQKGADTRTMLELELGMDHWATALEKASRRKVRHMPGAGSAGGLGFGLMAALNARVESGIDLVLDLVQFRTLLPTADLVVIGEGCLDAQSLHGKGPIGIARIAQEFGVPVAAVVGKSLVSTEEAAHAGISWIIALESLEPDLERSMARVGCLLECAGEQLVRLSKS